MAFVYAALILMGFCVFCLIAYSKIHWPYNLVIAVILFPLGVLTSRYSFNMMRRRGVMDILTGSLASYDLDNLEPVEGDGVFKITSNELPQALLEKKIPLNFTSISIWGDKIGRLLDSKQRLKSIAFEPEEKFLFLTFDSNCVLKIRNPRLILYGSSFFKILNATEVHWQIPTNDATHNHYSYIHDEKQIATKSNTKWKPHRFDLGIGMDAVYLQG